MRHRPKPIKITFKPLSKAVSGISRTSFVRRGLQEGTLLQDWAHIVGPQWSNKVHPLKIRFPSQGTDTPKRLEGTLYVQILSGAAVLFQHIEPAVIEKVNTHLGYKAISRLKMVQVSSLSPRPFTPPPPQATLNLEEQAQVQSHLKDVTDPDLKETLMKFGQTLKKREKKNPI